MKIAAKKISLLKLFFLLVLVSCSTTSKEKKDIKHFGHSENYRIIQSEMIFKRMKEDPRSNELIKAYFDFYAYSLRKNCSDLKFENAYPGIDLIQLPGIRYSEAREAHPTNENAIAADFFDLTDKEEFQRYEYFATNIEIRQWEFARKTENSIPEKNLVLLRTRKNNAIKYMVCTEKLGENLVCSEDRVIEQMADINNTVGLCELVKNRRPSIREDKLLFAIIDLLVQLEIIHEPSFRSQQKLDQIKLFNRLNSKNFES